MMLFALMLKVDVGWGQCGPNRIQNPNFNLGEPCTLPNNNASSSFENMCVDGWFRASQSPHHAMENPDSQIDVLCDNFNLPWIPYNGSEFTCMGGHEGIFQNLSILENPYLTFEFSLDVAGLVCEQSSPGNTMEILISKDLTDQISFFTLLNFPRQSLLVHNITNDVPTTLTTQFKVQPGSGFNQIWIRNGWPYPQPGMFTFSNAKLTCGTDAISDITSNLVGDNFSFSTTNDDNSCTFVSYSWNFGDQVSGSQNFSNSPTPNHVFSAQGTYIVCVDIVDCHGCCGNRCEEIKAPCPTPTAAFTHVVNCTGQNNSVSFNSSASTGEDLTYLWNFGGNNTNNTPNPTYSFSGNGTYTVTLTVTDACGNTSSTIQQVQVNCLQPNCGDGEPCISIGTPGGTVLLSTLIAGPNPIIPHTTWFFAPVVQNICFNLEGTLILDIPGAFFINTTWFCGSGASIRINDFGAWGSHWFVDSQLLGCSTMWRGIVLEPNPSGNFFVGGLTLRNTTIFDAYRGVELAGGRVINAEGSSFIDNYVGTYVPANGFNNFTDCRFENTGAMLPPYAGQPSWASRMHAGIEGNNVTLVRVTGTEGNSRSLFRNLSHGIKTFRSGVAVENSRFEIDDITSKQNSYYSYGIFEDKPNSFSVIFRNNFSSVNSCIYSSEGTMNGLQISNNILNLNSSFAQCHGIGIYSSNNINISISQINTFNINNEGGRAISVNTCNYNNLNIDENIFNVETSLGSQDLISIQNNTPLGSEGLIRENEFYLSKKRDIYITNSPKIVLLKNTYFYESARNLIGNSPNVFVKGNINSITGKTSWINISESQKVKICCNESNSPTGPSLVYTGGGNLDNKIVGNSINKFYLFHGTIAGLQPSHGNVFDPSGSQASINFYVPDIPYYQANRFRVDNTQIGNRPTWINEPWMIDEFFPLDGVSGGCGSYSSCNSDVFDLPVIDPDSIPLARMAQTITDDEADLTLTNYVNADRVFNNEQYPYRHRHIWENHYHLYQQVQKHPSIDWHSKLNSLEAGNILNENLTQGMIDWADVEQKRAKLYEMSEIQWEMYHQNQKVLKDVGVSIKNWYTDTNQEKDPNTLTSLHNQLNDAYQNIKEIGIEINSRVQEAMVSLSSDIVALDESLPFIAERKKVWQIDAIRTQSGIESITNAEWEEIERIAALCPLEYGSAVYEAHGLLMTKGVADSSYDFEQNCISFAENRSKSATQDESIEVFPNPTTGLIHINFGNNNLADKFILSNLLGQKIYEYTIPENQTQIDLDLSPMENGIYMFNILCKNQTIQKGKVIIID